ARQPNPICDGLCPRGDLLGETRGPWLRDCAPPSSVRTVPALLVESAALRFRIDAPTPATRIRRSSAVLVLAVRYGALSTLDRPVRAHGWDQQPRVRRGASRSRRLARLPLA